MDYDYLNQINEIHAIAVRRLLEGKRKMLPELAELCEDIGNLYLNVSDQIHAQILSHAPPAPSEGRYAFKDRLDRIFGKLMEIDLGRKPD